MARVETKATRDKSREDLLVLIEQITHELEESQRELKVAHTALQDAIAALKAAHMPIAAAAAAAGAKLILSGQGGE